MTGEAIRERYAETLPTIGPQLAAMVSLWAGILVAIGLAGLPALHDQRGGTDLFGHTLQWTITGFADQVAIAADLVAGQGDEGRPIVHLRGLTFSPAEDRASALVRDPAGDLYA